ALGLPPEKAAISVMLLTATPHVQAMILKGELRIAGVFLGAAWALGTFVVVGLVPHFLLLACLLFLGQFVADYLTRKAGKYAYSGGRVGVGVRLLGVAPPAGFGGFPPAVQRLEGVLLGLVAWVVVAVLWPRFPLAERAPPPSPAFPGEMDMRP